MFRRKAANNSAPDPRRTGVAGPAPSEMLDPTRVLTELLARPSAEGILENALAYASTLLGDHVNGYAIVRRGQDKVAAVFGYPRSLIGTVLSGPWAAMRPRILSEGSSELYESNASEVHKVLDAAGMREVPLSLVVPISDRGRTLGALVLDRTSSDPITPMQQEAVARWATAVAPILGMLDARDDWQQAARQISGAVVEAIESQEFDGVGHAAAVAENSLRIGRAMGLSARELEELWFAATLHDLGKIHGEQGHAQVGANFLQNVPHLSEAQKAIRNHHERWDGQGEPDKLSGEDIPLYARILAVANAYVRTGEVERVHAQSGKGLDPRVVAALDKALEKAAVS
ncbi:MAG: HD-GYP domain-containing protein [Deinococcus sp.]|uniref:HD domain-containing phosphohydrolase n=1 Tax=Deinococcus sp. TaxID=47478 RepID=UPI0026DBEB00|nr:HD-GYP domain-containing protein [Deinococcus sp.]MDO4244796.1 HD-GYP domain-containing protein [Deinococcus sp.]